MKKLQLPNVTEPAAHKEILAGPYSRAKIPAVIAAVVGRFAEFDAALPLLRRLNERPAVITPYASHLKGLYGSTRPRPQEILAAVCAVQPERCPYCGRPASKPITTDHFLPQSAFEEFSLYYKNLVRSCRDCNTTKDTDVWLDDGTRRFLHPYFDTCLERQCIRLLISPDPGPQGFRVPRFSLTFEAPGAAAEMQRIGDQHCCDLGVYRDMERYVYDEYMTLLDVCDGRRARGEISFDGLREEHFASANRPTELHGPNAWESIYHRAIANNEQLLRYLSGTEELPQDRGPADRAVAIDLVGEEANAAGAAQG